MISTFTLDNLVKIGSPGLTSERALLFFAPLVEAMEKYEINTVNRISAFLAQALHESGCFKILSENLNYSANGLMKTFPKYFPTQEIATQYAHNPRAIANRAYANRGGNSGESSGDGYRYRGRGIFQLTLRENYVRLSNDTKINFVVNPDLLTEVSYACLSAAWFFKVNGLNELADTNQFDALTKRVNAAKLGLTERKKFYEKALEVLKG